MFTGIVEETGKIEFMEWKTDTITLVVSANIVAGGAALGDSIAVNGCCLTVTKIEPGTATSFLSFDLLRETWQRTNFHQLSKGSLVNLERALPANGRLHGHFVTGHIDGVAPVRSFKQMGADWRLEVEAAPEILRYIIFKGAIAVDGMSLTIAEVTDDSFSIWIIPHTLQVTNLKEKSSGSLVNIEVDMLAKYAEKFIGAERARL
ncbi:MAG: riboflavin synthase [Verrucomicrobiales bacterium]